jgi:hypothetical protein
MTTTAEAIQAIAGRFHTAWQPKPYQFEDVPPNAALAAIIKNGSAPWARIQIKHNTGEQVSIGGPGNRKFEHMGIVLIEVYAPSGDGMVQTRALATVIRQAFEGISENNGVWYRNVRLNEVGASGYFSQANVIAEFSYEEHR